MGASVTNSLIQGNGTGALNQGAALLLAENNYWGADDGPAPVGSGDSISGNVDADPFFTSGGQLDAACDRLHATLSVEFPGITNVLVQVRVDDGIVGTADGAPVDAVHSNTGSASLIVLKGTYDLIVIKGGQQKVIDSVDCNGSTCLVTDIVSTLTVEFPGITNVLVQVRVDDGIVGTADGAPVDAVHSNTGSASLIVLKGTYDLIVIKGGQQKVIDSVDCTGSTCLVTDIVSTLTVNFPGITNVLVQVRVDDGIVGTADGAPVDALHSNTGSASLPVLKGAYDLIVIKGGEQKVIDSVDCTGSTCLVTDIVSTLTVNFPGITNVLVQVRVDDEIAGTADGAPVDAVHSNTGSASLVVLKGTYDLIVIKGGQQKVIDSVDCTGSTCLVTDIVSTLTVNFPGITNVLVQVRVDDGIVGTADGAPVDALHSNTGSASLPVLKGAYDLIVIKGGEQKVIDSVDCTGSTCLVTDIVSTLTVNFPGITNVLVQVRVDDEIVGTADGAPVDAVHSNTGSASLVVLKRTYDLIVIINGEHNVVDSVDCTGLTCEVDCTSSTCEVSLWELVVDIDIQPSKLNTGSNGVLPVAILGSSTVDVTGIDVSSLSLNQAGVAHDGHVEDVNGDGIDDLMVHFPIPDLVFDPPPGDGDEVTLTLTGEIDGVAISGEDTVIVNLAKEKGGKK